MRRSSNVVLSESRRFCSAALCDVLRRTGDGRDEEARVFEYTFPAGNIGFRLGLTRETPLPLLEVVAEGEVSFPRPADLPFTA